MSAAEEQLEGFFKSIQRYSWAWLNLIGQEKLNTWTPTLTITTVGNLSVAYTVRAGWYLKMGLRVIAHFNVLTSTFTHTSASGTVQLTGLPFTSANVTSLVGEGSSRVTGYTKANYTYVAPRVGTNTSIIDFVGCGSGQTQSILQHSDFPTGGTVQLTGYVTYFAK